MSAGNWVRGLAMKPLATIAVLGLGWLLVVSCRADRATDPLANADRGLQVSIAASDLAVGNERFAFVLLDADGKLVPDAEVNVTFFRLFEGEDENRSESSAEAVAQARAYYFPALIEEAGLYVIHTRFDRAGLWGAQIEGSLAGGEPIRPQRIRFTVAQRSAAPQVGEIPPPTHNRTLLNPERSQPGKATESSVEREADPPLDAAATDRILAAISSDPNPEPELYRWTVDEARASGKPTVVVFATPGFCQTAICGPVLEETKALLDTWGAAINFIHIEVYEDAASQKVVPEMKAWGLETEPWVFVLGKDGRVVARLEGSATEAELGPILRAVVNSP